MSFDHSRHKGVGNGWIVGAQASRWRGGAAKQAIFKIGHQPWAAARTEIPNLDVSEKDGFHRTSAVVIIVGLCVTVVEATATVKVCTAGYHVLGLGLITGSDA